MGQAHRVKDLEPERAEADVNLGRGVQD